MAAADWCKEARMLDRIFQPFVNNSPITVMAAAAVARLLSVERLDALFEKARQGQYVHELLFSTIFNLMAAVVAGTRKSIHHAYQTAAEPVGASVVAVYGKLQGVEGCTSQALVRDLAGQVGSLMDRLGGALERVAPGYHARIVDGNCLAASEHRIKELRRTAAGALPGKSLVVMDADRRLIRDVFPCEDGHAQERSLLEQVEPTIAKDDLWIDDRNFCTFAFLHAIEQRQAYFITRQHGNMTCEPLEIRRQVGPIEGGTIDEQRVKIRGDHGKQLALRRIEIRLDHATGDGDKVIYLLSNLPSRGARKVDARRIAELYRGRWTIETAFQELAVLLNSEINTLGYPKAALFGFCVALVLYNAVALMRAALRGAHGAKKIEEEVSNYYIAAELETTSRGMLIAIPEKHWQVFTKMSQARFTVVMLMLAGKVNLQHFRKHPRGPKKSPPKRTYDPAHPHVSTARILDQRLPTKR
jgi:IS4 transposase